MWGREKLEKELGREEGVVTFVELDCMREELKMYLCVCVYVYMFVCVNVFHAYADIVRGMKRAEDTQETQLPF